MGRKSTAQPRPNFKIPPRGIGPIAEPNENDVLCGRGGRINNHQGNIQFREIVNSNKKEYLAKSTKKLEKAHIAARIVDGIRAMNPPGRFLKEDPRDGFWYDIGDQKAVKKAGQALREDAPGIRNEMGDVSSGEEDAQKKKTATIAASPMHASTPLISPQESSEEKSPEITFAEVAPAAAGDRSHVPPTQQGSSPWATESPPFAAKTMEAPLPHPSYAHVSPGYGQAQPPPYRPPPPSVPAAPHAASPGSAYRVPAQFYQPVHHGANSNLSAKAIEVMKHSSVPPTADSRAGHPPTRQVAFGKYFTPTERSSGSTISGLSGFSGATSGMRSSQPSASEAASGMRISNESLRSSQFSDLTFSLGSYGLSRSNSFPEVYSFGSRGAGFTRYDARVAAGAAAMKDHAWEANDPFFSLTGSKSSSGASRAVLTGSKSSSGTSESKSGTSSSSRSRPSKAGATRGRTASSASAMSGVSLASGGSQRSRLSSIISIGSEMSWLNPLEGENADDSSRSAMSEVSYDVLALDLADPGHSIKKRSTGSN